jgi:hypothetical protein
MTAPGRERFKELMREHINAPDGLAKPVREKNRGIAAMPA